MSLSKFLVFLLMIFLIGCSAAYKEIKNIEINNPSTFHEHLIDNYKKNASFEAEEMHDWNSAKLYSEKVLKALKGENVYPELIDYWKIPLAKARDIKTGYKNLLSIYDEALIKDPENLAKAVSSLDCWAEQEEEKWQTWDINKCKNTFHTSMHNIYKIISAENDKKEIKEKNNNLNKNETNILVVTQNKQKEVMQIIYFDFDDSGISDVSRNTLIDFLDKNKKELSRYIILGHTDTKGTSDYNINLSLERAQAVKEILINQGILDNSISLLGKGENELAVNTPDETKHPANRRAEVKIIN